MNNKNHISSIAITHKSFFSMLSNGDFGLAKTFLLHGLFLGFAMSIFLTPLASIKLFVVTTLVVATLYSIPSHMGVWRAANKYEGRKVWATLAKVYVKVNIFLVLFLVCASAIMLMVDRYLSNV
jgi:hypothetical protein